MTNKITKPHKASIRERERERVKSLRDFDLEFHNFNNLKRYFNSAFLILSKGRKKSFYGR